MNTAPKSPNENSTPKQDYKFFDSSIFDEIFLLTALNLNNADILQYRLEKLIDPLQNDNNLGFKEPIPVLKVTVVVSLLILLIVLCINFLAYSDGGAIGLDLEESLLLKTSQSHQQVLLTLPLPLWVPLPTL
jgi:hypothetical protein